MKIAACQLPHVHNDIDRALELIGLQSTNAQRQGVELLCFPECFLQGYDLNPEHVATVALDLKSVEFARILDRLKAIGPVIVLGLTERDADAGAQLLARPCNNMLRPSNAEAWRLRHNEIRCERAHDANVWLMSSDVTGEHDGRISYGPTAIVDHTGCVIAQVPLLTTGMVIADLTPRHAP